jgi:hypothetical protein
MRVIFLDIDGVLNSKRFIRANKNVIQSQTSLFERGAAELDPAAVKLMSDFATEMEAEVVISSSWRRLHKLSEICSMLKLAGWKARMPIGVTPEDKDRGFRGDEVRMWLDIWDKKQGWTSDPHPHHVIFDDDADFHNGQPIVRTQWETGITEADIDIARGILAK